MIKKTLAGFVATAMLLTGGFVTSSPKSAVAAEKYCNFYLRAPDGTIASYVKVVVYWLYSSSGASVKPSYVRIENYTARSITLKTNRWQNSAGTVVQRGTSGNIAPNSNSTPWFPTKWIPKTQSPYVSVAAYATTRPGMDGYVKVTPTGCNYVL